MNRVRTASLLLAGSFALSACTDDAGLLSPQPTETPTFSAAAAPAEGVYFIISGHNGRLPADLEASVAAAGATLVSVTPQIGAALVRSSDPRFGTRFSRVAGIQAAIPNVLHSVVPQRVVETFALDDALAIGYPPASGAADPLFDFQWGHTAIDAIGAWDLGARGAGVRVAVIDNGIRSDHPDLAPNLNVGLSRSFVAGEQFDSPAGSHGSHVAGTIAAAENGLGVIGVAPEAEIVALKSLSAITGTGSSYNTMAALVYAGDIRADVANMSLGSYLPRRGSYTYIDDNGTPDDPSDDFQVRVTGAEIQELLHLYQRAVDYAHSRGVTVVAAAGNSAIDLLHDASAMVLPAELRNVISVSATGPIGWAIDQETDLDVLASYSNYGKTGVTFSAPGGNYDLPSNDFCAFLGQVVPCYAFDGVMSTTATGWAWSFGTSMAAPHVSATAALMIGENGGAMSPQAVLKVLRRSADDVGKRGKDDAHGYGAVNAYEAVR